MSELWWYINQKKLQKNFYADIFTKKKQKKIPEKFQKFHHELWDLKCHMRFLCGVQFMPQSFASFFPWFFFYYNYMSVMYNIKCAHEFCFKIFVTIFIFYNPHTMNMKNRKWKIIIRKYCLHFGSYTTDHIILKNCAWFFSITFSIQKLNAFCVCLHHSAQSRTKISSEAFAPSI